MIADAAEAQLSKLSSLVSDDEDFKLQLIHNSANGSFRLEFIKERQMEVQNSTGELTTFQAAVHDSYLSAHMGQFYEIMKSNILLLLSES